MVKKVLIAVTCGIVTVSMCACASGTVILDQAQDVISNNMGSLEDYLPEDVANAIASGIAALPENGTSVSEENNSADETVAAEEETTLAEEAAAPENETQITLDEADDADAADIADDSEEAADEITDAAEDETKVALDEADDADAADIADDSADNADEITADAEDETKVALNEAEDEDTTSLSGKADEKETAADEKDDALTDEKETTDLIGISTEKEEVKEIAIELDTDKAKADGESITDSSKNDLYISNDIIFYQDQEKYPSGNAYGEGTKEDMHTEDEAAENAVLNITAPGTYRLTGKWAGQIRIDLGDDAASDKDAKVSLILDNADIKCTVAPAIYFKNVYECEDDNSVDMAADNDYSAMIEEIFGSDSQSGNGNSGQSDDDYYYSTDELTPEQLYELFSFFMGDNADQYFSTDDVETATPDDISSDDDSYSNIFGKDDKDSKADYGKADSYIGAKADSDVDTSDAGAVIIIAEGSSNTVEGSHVARIFEDSKTSEELTKQDGAITSHMSLVIESEDTDTVDTSKTDDADDKTDVTDKADNEDKTEAEEKADTKETADAEIAAAGTLSIVADKEGIETNRHLTVNGGDISILSADDAINANEDYVSVVTINDGTLHIMAGTGLEGDGIDSNGYIVVNGGYLVISAAPEADSGLDSNLGSYINGGVVVAYGSDRDMPSADSKAKTINLKLAGKHNVNEDITIKDSKGKTIFEMAAKEDQMLSVVKREYSGLTITWPEFEIGQTYSVYINGVQQTNTGTELAEFDPFAQPEGSAEFPFGNDGIMSDGPGQSSVDDDADSYGFFFGNGNNVSGVSPYGEYDDQSGYSTDDFDTLNEYADLFRHFGISMDEVEDYIGEWSDDADDSQSGNSNDPWSQSDNSGKQDNPFSGPDGHPQNPGGAGPQNAVTEPTTEFTFTDVVTTFIGVTDLSDKTELETDTKDETTDASKADESTDSSKTDGDEKDTDIQEDTSDKNNTGSDIKESEREADKKDLTNSLDGKISFSLPFSVAQRSAGMNDLEKVSSLSDLFGEEETHALDFYKMARIRNSRK